MGSDGLQVSSDGGDEKWLYSGCTFKIKRMCDGLDMEFEKKGGMQEDSRISELTIRLTVVPFSNMEKIQQLKDVWVGREKLRVLFWIH